MLRILRATVLSTCLVAAFGMVAGGSYGHPLVSGPNRAYADSTCQLAGPAGNVQHVIYIQFDNVHFERDNPNVPSDLEQMPNLLNFMKTNGVLLTNAHTPLIAHTATDILTSFTGLYGDRMGVPIANSFRYFNPNGTSNLGVSFAYWTDPIYDPTTSTPTDTTYNMVTENGKNTPAPWVPYTRAGCNWGGVATANAVLENIGTDIPTVFGPNSPQADEVKSNPDQATADFVGIGVHCAQGSSVCSTAGGGRPDVLPGEPYGYGGYLGLFGNKYVAPQISPGGPMTDLNGNVISDGKGHNGFPGFDGMPASVSLSYVAAMQEHGVPVTYAYISDAHDKHPSGPAYGPGEAGYVAALKSYDSAFGTFFSRLSKDGINSSNTLFVFTTDEQDHFAGGPPSPANCDGVTTPCTYSKIGEVNGNLTGLLATQQNIATPFTVHADSAPNFYVTGNPSQYDPVTRAMERGAGALTATNPYTGKSETIANYLADQTEMSLLHMITSDPARNATFTMFAKPDYFLATGKPNCSSPCISIQPGFAWNHGTISPDINTTWVGMVGPGVAKLGVDSTTWADETDFRPTMMWLTGLRDDYAHDGRVLFEDVAPSALSPQMAGNLSTFLSLAQVYKQINACVGQFAYDTLAASTAAMNSNTPQDAMYQRTNQFLRNLATDRAALTSQIRGVLETAEFQGGALDQGQASSLTGQAKALLARADALAAAAAGSP